MQSPIDNAAARAAGGVWDRVVERTAQWTGLPVEVAHDILGTVVLVVVLSALRAAVLRLVRRRTADLGTLYRWKKWTSYVVVVVLLVGLFRIWVGETGSLATFLGLLTAGVAIALRDPLVNFAGWGFILWRRPFVVGDRITIQAHTGDVVDRRVFQFTLLEVDRGSGGVRGGGQSTGRLIHVPNGWVFTHSVVNFTSAFAYVWHEVPVVVTFESDWRAAKAILFEVVETCTEQLSEGAERTLRAAAREYFIYYSKLTPTVYTRVVGEGIELTMRFLVSPRRARGAEQDLWEAILDAFGARDDIDFAYPTTRLYRNDREGKPAAGGPPRPGTGGAARPGEGPDS